MKTLVVLSAVLAAAMARPGLLEAVQSPTPDAASSQTPSARTSTMSNQEFKVGDLNPGQTGSSLQNPVPDQFQTSRPLNPTQSNSFRVSDASDSGTYVQYVDNPHIGLPFGTVLPLREPINYQRISPPLNTADTLTTMRVDSPHVGLPVNSPSNSPVGTTLLSRPISATQTSTSSNPSFHNSLYKFLTNVPSNTGSSPAVNSADAHFSNQPQRPFVNYINAGSSDVFIPNNFPTGNANVFFPVSKSISHVPNSVSLPSNGASTSFPIHNGNLPLCNPYGGFFAQTPSPNFPSKASSAVFTPSNSHGKFLCNLPVNSATNNHPSNTPQNILPRSSPTSNPFTNPLTNIAFTINNPSPGLPTNVPNTDVPTSNPSSNRLVDSGNVLLFSDNVPFGNVVNTAQGPILVGGPSNFAVFPKQPSLDDINQILAAYKSLAASAAAAAVNPALGQSASSPQDAVFFAGVPVNLGGSNYH